MRAIEGFDLANVSGGIQTVEETIDFVDDGHGNKVPRWTVDGPIEVVTASAIIIGAYIFCKYYLD